MTKLFPYQKQGVRRSREFNHRCLIADEMGLGKSIQALAAIVEDKLFPAVVVCPAIVKYHWEQEAASHYGLKSHILEGRTPPRRCLINPRGLVIINFEIAKYWKDWLRELNPRMLVIDEAVRVKNPKAQCSKALRGLAWKTDHVIGLSGAPLTNRPAELWSILNMIRPDKYPAFLPFAMKFCKPSLEFGQWKYRGAENLGLLNRRLKKHLMIRRLRKDVQQDLPRKRRSAIPVDLEDYKEYQEAESDTRRWMRKNFSGEKQSSDVRMEQLKRYGYLRRMVARLKLPAIYEWIDDYLEESSDKIIVFTLHRKIIQALHERYADISVQVDGSITGRNRQKAFEQFNGRKRTRILFGNMTAAGIGWNGTAAPNTLTVELPWTPPECVQAEDRVNRIGQKAKRTMSYYLIARNTIEMPILDGLTSKFGIISHVLDGDATHDFNLVNQVTEYLMKRGKTA